MSLSSKIQQGIGGSVVEVSPATRLARVRLLACASILNVKYNNNNDTLFIAPFPAMSNSALQYY